MDRPHDFRNFNLWEKSIYIRILIIFLIAVVPIYFVGISVFSWGITLIRQQAIDTKTEQLQFYTESLEDSIQRLILLQSDSNRSTELNILSNQYKYMTNYERSFNIDSLRDVLSSIKYSSGYAQDVTAFIPSIHKKVGAQTGLDDMSPEDSTLMKISNKDFPSSQIISYRGALYSNVAYLTGSQKFLYSILIQISISQLRSDLMQFIHDKGSFALIVNDVDRSVIASAGNLPPIPATEYCRSVSGSSSGGAKIGVFSGQLNNSRFVFLYAPAQTLGFTIYDIVPESALTAPISFYQMCFWVFVVAAAVIITIFTLLSYRIIKQPINVLIAAFDRVDKGDINFSISHRYNDEFASLYGYFNQMLQSLKSLIDQTYKQQIMLQNAELKQLQAQINPHFLYNSYFQLHRMIKQEDYERATLFSKYMGKYFQFITRGSKSYVTLKSEVDHARTYVEIQQMRFEGRIRAEFGEMREQYSNVSVPRLILQPIVENAYEHGLREKVADGLLRVSFDPLPDGVRILVEDNGDDLSDDDLKRLQDRIRGEAQCTEVTGLINIQARLRITSEGKNRLHVRRSELGGLCVCVEIRT